MSVLSRNSARSTEGAIFLANVTVVHSPYRSWCSHCVRGRGKERPRHDALPDADGIPKLAIDYLLMGDSTSPLTILVTPQ